jgi:dTDP-4-amino-4,6-dideoxygalactose transaminase
MPRAVGKRELLRRPVVSEGSKVLAALESENIVAVFHYVPLHDSPAGRRHGRAIGDLAITNDLASRLIRLPLYMGLQQADQGRVVDALTRILTSPS